MSAFVRNVRQVRFNAWHYSDNYLWAGLISHLFQVLAATGIPDTDTSREAAQVQRDRDELQTKVKAKEKECVELDEELTAADSRSRPVGFLKELGSPAAITRNLVTFTRQASRDFRASLSTLLILAALLGGAYAAWHFLGAWAVALTAGAGTVASPAIAILVKLWSWHQKSTRFGADLYDRLVARQHDMQEELRTLRDQLALIDAAVRLSAFLDERGGPDAYGDYQGLPGRVCADLKQLSKTLADARADWLASGSPTDAPLERIVLYIDDLDRCPPRRVVEVLEAVHLMLALDLFVVVVAVDARWLITSLEYHHRDLFRTAAEEAASTTVEGRGNELATPVDYLDKIFQIPYVLLPPAAEVAGRYLQALLPSPGPVTGKTAAALPSAASLSARGESDTPEDGLHGQVLASAQGSEDEAADRSKPPLVGQLPGETAEYAVLTDLRPPSLELSSAEIEFLARLGGLVPTPRAAKRMVNIYRLIRISIPDEDLQAFIGDEKSGPYQAVQLLLAMLTGSPAVAGDLFRALLEAPPGENLLSVVQEIRSGHPSEDLLARIESEIIALGTDTGLSLTAADCQQWCSVLARFSFHTRDLAKINSKTKTGIFHSVSS